MKNVIKIPKLFFKKENGSYTQVDSINFSIGDIEIEFVSEDAFFNYSTGEYKGFRPKRKRAIYSRSGTVYKVTFELENGYRYSDKVNRYSVIQDIFSIDHIYEFEFTVTKSFYDSVHV